MTKQGKMYLVFTFLITWGCWWALSILSSYGLLKFGEIPFWILYVIGGNGPFIAALIGNMLYTDKDQRMLFWKHVIQVKNISGCYVWIVIFSFLSAIPWIMHIFIGDSAGPVFRQPVYMIILMLPVMIIGGGLEEVGWRGVLLPDMLKKVPKLLSAVSVAAIWALWHLPLWFIKDVPQENSNFLLFAISVLGLSLLLTTLYDRTKSIFMCIMLHSFTNSLSSVLNSPNVNPYLSSFVKLMFCLTVFAVYDVFFKTKRTVKQIY